MLGIRVFANHWLQHFIAKFHQYFQGKDLILCFELNILDDLKIVEYRNFSLMQQKQFLFCVFFLTIIIILQLIMGMFDTYRILAIIYIMFIILAIVYSSYSNYLAIQIYTGLASLLPINSLLAASIMGKLWLSCLIIQQLARGGNLNLAITTKVQIAQLGQQMSFLCFFFVLEELASYSQLYF